MARPIITRRPGGEYSTVELPDGSIETMWFGDDGTNRFVGRTWPPNIREVLRQHIEEDERK